MKTKHSNPKQKIPWTPTERWVQRAVLGLVALLALATGWLAIRDERDHIVVPAGTDIRFPVATLKPGRLHLLTYVLDQTRSIPVAVERGDDQVIRVALGTCRSCWRSIPRASSGNLVCGRCSKTMNMPDPATARGEKRGGCALAPVPYSVTGDQLVVRGESVASEFARQFLPAQQKD